MKYRLLSVFFVTIIFGCQDQSKSGYTSTSKMPDSLDDPFPILTGDMFFQLQVNNNTDLYRVNYKRLELPSDIFVSDIPTIGRIRITPDNNYFIYQNSINPSLEFNDFSSDKFSVDVPEPLMYEDISWTSDGNFGYFCADLKVFELDLKNRSVRIISNASNVNFHFYSVGVSPDNQFLVLIGKPGDKPAECYVVPKNFQPIALDGNKLYWQDDNLDIDNYGITFIDDYRFIFISLDEVNLGDISTKKISTVSTVEATDTGVEAYSLSLDKQKIIVRTENRLYLAFVDDWSPKIFLEDKLLSSYFDFYKGIVWSADSKYFAVASDAYAWTLSIYLYSIDTNTRWKLAETPGDLLLGLIWAHENTTRGE